MDSVADPDLGSGAFLTPGSGMGKKSGSGSGSGMNNPDHISESLRTIFWVKINSLMRIRDGKSSDLGWKTFGSGILDKHPGSTTLFVGSGSTICCCLAGGLRNRWRSCWTSWEIPRTGADPQSPGPRLTLYNSSSTTGEFNSSLLLPSATWSRPTESWASLNLIQQQLNNRWVQQQFIITRRYLESTHRGLGLP